MSVQNVNSTTHTYDTKTNTAPVKAEEAAQAQTPAVKEEPAYTVEKQQTYKPDYKKISAMKTQQTQNFAAFEQMVTKLFAKQGKKVDDFFQSILDGKGTNLRDQIAELEVDEETAQWAQEAIGEDGVWGVDAVSGRILDFAKALSGGDPSKIDTLRAAVEKGFGQAESQWGGKLPEISQKTYDKVMAGFDEWANEGKPAEETAETEE